MRRSTITCGDVDRRLCGDGVDHHAPEELVDLRLGAASEAALDVGAQLVDRVELADADGEVVVERRQLLLPARAFTVTV